MFEFVLPFIQGLTTLASTVGSGVMNYLGVKETNEANRQIASDNRDWQAEESQKERDYQMEMWDKNNAYNSPSAEKSRLMEAGLNPFLGNSQLGQGSTMPSPTSLQGAPNAPTMQNPYAAFDMRVPMDFMIALGQKKVADANSANQNAQSLTEVAKAAKELYDVFGPDKAMQMIAPVYGRIVGATFDGNNFEARAKSELSITQSQREIQTIHAEVAKRLALKLPKRILLYLNRNMLNLLPSVVFGLLLLI